MFKKSQRYSFLGYLILTAGLFFALYYSNYQSNKAIEAITANRTENIAVLNQLNKEQCDEIETLKFQFRKDAIQDFKELDETLELLNIKKTDAIEKRAIRNKNTILRRFRSDTCPRQIIK